MEMNKDDTFERYMGPYYQQPGHDYLRTLMKEIEVPTKYYKNVVDTNTTQYIMVLTVRRQLSIFPKRSLSQHFWIMSKVGVHIIPG